MMSNCKLCLADCAFKGEDMKKGNCKGYIPMSNADRIRAMSDEELVNWLCEKMDCSICKRNIQSDGECDNYSKNGVSMAILNWLQSPAEEET